MAQPVVVDGICHPYNFSEENSRGRFERIFNGVLCAFYPLIQPPQPVLSKEEWQRDWQDDEFVETMFLESDTGIRYVHAVLVLAQVRTVSSAIRRTIGVSI